MGTFGGEIVVRKGVSGSKRNNICHDSCAEGRDKIARYQEQKSEKGYSKADIEHWDTTNE